PIFAFGLVVTGIVCKGLVTAAEMAKADREAKARAGVRPTSSGSQPDSIPAIAVVSKPAVTA
ncbi:MAG TPA: hypothetical protein VLO30_03520, partial [Chthoniobacterales bacterium]|nr:hypothetical protein [Chthoniobacterales bacterium]